ncbi:serine O-acetyltransferase [Saliterribacillus persicus]|uniref:Serine acetyltransferase n=1 Tax=Saliterribacillus persicus TaxID=930114 RepID=A0A368YB62_9BACI|nr:DapH/DapD/GlmU-related protein [Saliterribacillus persicus]RCW77365.1 serine O-acetyltransferase [Saliterribacillus persicus]
MNITKQYTLARWLYLRKVPLIPKIIKIIMRILFSCDIPYTSNIHKTVQFPHHGIGVVIGHDTVIGENTKVLQNVTIGGRSGVRANPVIGKNVIIGAGACILGDVKIGDNAKIGANAVVIKNVPTGCTAVGVPAKLLNSKL